MINVENFNVFFKHHTVHALEQKAMGQIVVDGKTQPCFSLPEEEWKEYDYLVNNDLNGRTECIVENNLGFIVYKGRAECKIEDTFSKEEGCYRSLNNATKNASYHAREKLFKAFSERKPDLTGKILVKGEYYDEDFLYDLVATHDFKNDHFGI